MKTIQTPTPLFMHSSTAFSPQISPQSSVQISAQDSAQDSPQDSPQISVSDSTQASASYVCGHCKRSLPTEAFYIDKKTGCPRSYCKECRKAASRQQRGIDKNALVTKRNVGYPVITRIVDPVLRKALILRALQTVAASIERKKQKQREADLDTEY